MYSSAYDPEDEPVNKPESEDDTVRKGEIVPESSLLGNTGACLRSPYSLEE